MPIFPSAPTPATGQLTTWEVDGIRLTHYQWATAGQSEPAELPLATVSLLLCRHGRCAVHSTGAPVLHLAGPQHAALFPAGALITLRADAPATELIVLAWPIAGFVEVAAELAAPLASFGAAVQVDAFAVLGPAPLPLTLSHAVGALLTAEPASSGTLRQLWRRARLWEVVAIQLAALEHPLPIHTLSEYDQERLRFARDYLLQHTQLPPTLPELARLAGLNECKLKRGFKALFGQPAFAYLAEWRLLDARRRLTADPALTASEVAFELGYASLQHFSAAYKQRFGHSPRARRIS